MAMELVPGGSVGPFKIGMPLTEAISYLQKSQKQIKRVDFIYNDTTPLSTCILINLVEEGILLRFEPSSQRLQSIDVHEPTRVSLSYGGTIFSGPHFTSTFASLYQLFGPTYPGSLVKGKGSVISTGDKGVQVNSLYKLSYPGLVMFFPIHPKFEAIYTNSQEMPLEFPDGTTPVVKCLCVFKGTDMDSPLLPDLPSSSHYFEEIRIRLGTELIFSKSNKIVRFHDSPQDVIGELGKPSRIFFKAQDKLRIHAATLNVPSTTSLGGSSGTTAGGSSGSSSSGILSVGTDYFYNYFKLGIDVMFDGATHRAKKFVLHTNFPGNKDFNKYVKCNFRIEYSQFDTYNSSVVSSSSAASSAVPLDSKSSSVSQTPSIGPDTKFDEVKDLLGDPGKPLVNDHTSINNPFGGTLFYAYRFCIFEVMKNNHISSITLFSEHQ